MKKNDLKNKASWFMATDRCDYSGLPVSCQETLVSKDPKGDFHADIARLGNNILLQTSYGYGTSFAGSELVAFIADFISRHFDPEIEIVYIEDYSGLTGADAEARKKYISYLKNNDHFDCIILYQLPPFFKISFSLAKKLHIYADRAHAVNTYDQAIDLARQLINRNNAYQNPDHNQSVFIPDIPDQSADASAGPKLFRFFDQILARLKEYNVFFTEKAKQKQAEQYSDDLIRYIAAIDWRKPGIQPTGNLLYDELSSKKVSDAISFIKSEIDTLMEERDTAEAVLRESETRYRLLVEHAKAGFMEYDYATNRITGINDEFLLMTGYSEQELKGKSPIKFLTEESQAIFKKRLSQIFSGEPAPQDIVYQCIKKNGDIWWALMNTNVTYLNNRPQKESVVISDISKLKHTEKQLLEYQDKLKRLSIKLSKAEADQRRSMASHLHETIGQELFVMQLQLNALEKSTGTPALLSALTPIKEQLLKIIKETKNLTFDLSPPVLYDFGFQEALQALSEAIELKHSIHVQTSFEGEMDSFDDEIKVIVYRNIKELIHNTVKHADANHITMRLKSSSSGLNVELTDDGVGFDADKYSNETISHDGFGLFDIREKLNHLGGHLIIDSAPGQGTSISMQVPLDIYH